MKATTIQRCQCSNTACACKGECTKKAILTIAHTTADGVFDQIHVCHRCGDTRYPQGYAWLITIDHDDDAARSAAGTIGPRDCSLTAEDIGFLPHVAFRLLDDDGELVYEGVFVGDATSELAFGPLDDFGAPDAGCTVIQYKNRKGEWKPL